MSSCRATNAKHDTKVRKLESKCENAKLAVARWLDVEREKLLSAADPEARALVLATEERCEVCPEPPAGRTLDDVPLCAEHAPKGGSNV